MKKLLEEIHKIFEEGTSFDEFKDRYLPEINESIYKLRKLYKFAKDKSDKEFGDIIEQIEGILSPYNDAIRSYIIRYIQYRHEAESYNFIRYAINEVGRDGTEPKQLINAIEDVYYEFFKGE